MARASLLDRLEVAKTHFGADDRKRLERLLARLRRYRARDAASLIRLHEALLFIRAHPHSPTVLRRVERLLATFHRRVTPHYASSAEDLDALAEPEVSGIAGSRFSAYWGYDPLRDLAARHASELDVDWEAFGDEGHLVDVLKLLLPLFEDGAYVENPVPYRRWMSAARIRGERDLGFLLRQIHTLPASDRVKARLFDTLEIPVEWRLGRSAASRTNMRLPAGRIFHQRGPLVARREVSLAREVADAPPLPTRELSVRQGARILALARDAMATRMRELYGFTYGDPRRVIVADAGRGVRFFFSGIVPEHRLPLIGYHAALISRNGVLVGYAESLALFERSEFGLNMFYTFREGESAWIYARLLRLFRQLVGIAVVSIDPYQIGFHNEEAIESGAFWFYPKLGFRPVRREQMRVVDREEKRMEAQPGHRTTPGVLRRLAESHLVWEAPGATVGDWDRFHFRNLGLAAQRRVAERFGGDGREMEEAAVASVARALGVRPDRWSAVRQRAFAGLAPALVMIPGLSRWTKTEKRELVRIVEAKAAPDEARYVRRLQRHARLREAFIALGSRKGYRRTPTSARRSPPERSGRPARTSRRRRRSRR